MRAGAHVTEILLRTGAPVSHHRCEQPVWSGCESCQTLLPRRKGVYDDPLPDVYVGIGRGCSCGKNQGVLCNRYRYALRLARLRHAVTQTVFRSWRYAGVRDAICEHQGLYSGSAYPRKRPNYLNDMSKHNNPNEIKKTRLVYDNITVQLFRRSTRFQYKLVKKTTAPRNSRTPSSGWYFPVLSPSFIRSSRSRSPWRTTRISILSKSVYPTLVCCAPRNSL